MVTCNKQRLDFSDWMYIILNRQRALLSLVYKPLYTALQCWRQWREGVEYSKGSRVALGYFTDLTLRKAFNQWLAWACHQQHYSTQLHLAMQAR